MCRSACSTFAITIEAIMIRQLHIRTNADRFANDVRASRRRFGRYVYLTTIAGILLYLANLFAGHLLWLDADGIVTADRVAVAFPYEVEVLRVDVRSGQNVKEGEPLARVRSAQVAESIATLTARYADTYARQAELQIRVDVANAVIGRAAERLSAAEANLKRVNETRASGFASDSFVGNAIRERYAALQEMAVREAERRSSTEQLANLRRAQDDARAALDKLREQYADGHVVAPATGVIGARLAMRGDVLRPGDNLAEVYVGRKFVLGYLGPGTFYEVEPNDRVLVSYGFAESGGTVVEILPITVPLPPEFQKTFRPASRGQVARILLDDDALFPLSAKVRVTGPKWFSGWHGKQKAAAP
jgi:multidrug efflux pump subunit AcrA (membrane-fusion protein)